MPFLLSFFETFGPAQQPTYLDLRAAMTAGSSVLATPKEVSRLIQVGQDNLSLDLLLLSLAILLPPPLPLLLPHPVHHEEVEHSAPVVLHGGVELTSRIAVASLPSALHYNLKSKIMIFS